jgi:hypothetical protein
VGLQVGDTPQAIERTVNYSSFMDLGPNSRWARAPQEGSGEQERNGRQQH